MLCPTPELERLLNSGLQPPSPPLGRCVSLEPAGSARATPSSSRTNKPHGQWRCCVAYGQGQHGGVDASERRRKCELAGIFYSCEYVHRAVRAVSRSASAPYLEALTIGLLVILFSSRHTRRPLLCPHDSPLLHPSPTLTPPSPPHPITAPYPPFPSQPLLPQPNTHPFPPPNSSTPAPLSSDQPTPSPPCSFPPVSSPQRQGSTSWRRRRRNEFLHRCPTLRLLELKKKNLSNLLCLNGTRYKGKLSWKYYANSQI